MGIAETERNDIVRGMKNNEKNFGYLCSFIFFLLATEKFYKSAIEIGSLYIAVSLMFCVTSLLRPNLLKPVHFLWIKLGDSLQKIMTPLILSVFFFLIIAPIGLVKRLFTNNSFNLKFDEKLDTYWEKDIINPESNMKTQF
jgi:hypothetical protein